MTSKKTYFKTSLVLILLVIILMVFLSDTTGCCGYRKFTLRNAPTKCSFEYPSSFTRPSVNRDNYSTSITAERPVKKPPRNAFHVTVRKIDDYLPDSRTLLEYDLLSAGKNQNIGEFELKDRSSTTVDGVPGEQIAFVNHFSSEYPDVMGKYKRIPILSYKAYFEKNGFLWDIAVVSDPILATQTKADFEHILQSFKFLD